MRAPRVKVLLTHARLSSLLTTPSPSSGTSTSAGQTRRASSRAGRRAAWDLGRTPAPFRSSFAPLAYKGVPRPILDVAEWFT